MEQAVSEKRESGASIAANGKDSLYQKLCDITDSKKFPPVWEVRKCTTWDDESKITVIGTGVAEDGVLEVVCVKCPTLFGG